MIKNIFRGSRYVAPGVSAQQVRLFSNKMRVLRTTISGSRDLNFGVHSSVFDKKQNYVSTLISNVA